MSDYRMVKLADLRSGDVVRGWEDGDPYRGTVVSVTPRMVQRYSARQPDQWVYDVTYEGGYVAFSQDGDALRKVLV